MVRCIFGAMKRRLGNRIERRKISQQGGRVEMNNIFNHNKHPKTKAKRAKEIVYLALFVALAIATQTALSILPGVELVTLLFVSYAFAFGAKNAMLAATAFSLLRQLIFGFFPTVLILYLIYYNALALGMGLLGKAYKEKVGKALLPVTILSCFYTVGFTFIDFLITSYIHGYSAQAKQVYLAASLPVMATQVVCVAVTVGALFYPLCKIFKAIKNKTL